MARQKGQVKKEERWKLIKIALGKNLLQVEQYTMQEMQEILKQEIGEVKSQYLYPKSASNVDYAIQFALMMQFQYVRKVEKILIMIIARDAGVCAKVCPFGAIVMEGEEK